MEKYIGRNIVIIYLDKHGKITQRRVEVRSVKGSRVRVYCLYRKAPRVLQLENILAVRLVKNAV